jgi:hypothetical protein
MLMQGISEEDQVAMAIALSLREAETAQNDNDGGADGDGADGGGASEGSSSTNGDENGSDETDDAQDANTEEEEGVSQDRT